jgi:cell shape-determining protein MreC
MAMSGKLLKVVLIILVFISLALASVAAFLLQQQIQKNTIVSARLNEVLNENKTISASLDGSRQEIARLNGTLSDSEAKLKSLNATITSLEDEKKALADTINSVKNDLNNAQSKNTQYSKSIDDLKSQIEQDKKQLETLKKEKDDLVTKISSLEQQNKETVKLERIVVTPGKTPGISQPLSGQIVSIDKKMKFLIIDLGEKDGVKVGDIFVCLNNKEKDIGQVKVEKIYESLSAADFLPNLKVDSLKEGARVIKK